MFQFIRYFLYVLVPLAIGLGSYIYLHNIFFVPFSTESQSKQLIDIKEQIAISDICKQLADQKIIRKPQSLCLYRKLSGSTTEILPGEYELSASMTPAEILEKLEKGERYLRTVTIKDGLNIWQIDDLFAESGLLADGEFETTATDADLLSRAGIAAASFEGYLGAGEYSFSKGLSPSKIIWEMIERAEQNSWKSDYSERIFELRMSRHELLTLASIIHKASADSEERRKISSTLHNRLKNGMKLLSEEALIYALRDFNGTLQDADKELPSPYNTFINYGLPPGPILNPSLDAIEAALYPPESTYLFYGRRKDGSLVFATTQAEFKDELDT